MAGAIDHAGFRAVLREADRLGSDGWRLGSLGLELRRPIRLAGIPWTLSQFVQFSEAARRRVSFLSLAPRIRLAPKRRRELENEVAPLIVRLGFRRRKTPILYPGMSFEKSFDGTAGSVDRWPRMLEALDVCAGKVRPTKDPLAVVIRGMFRRGWRPRHVSLDAPTRSFTASRRWRFRTSLYWMQEGGITLLLDLQPRKRMLLEEVRAPETRGILDQVARRLSTRGLRSRMEESLQEVWREGPSPVSLLFSRDRIPPARVREAVDGLRDWKPSVEKGRGS